MQKLIYQVPLRLHAFPWKRLFCTGEHGISLSTFYGSTKASKVNDAILLIKTSKQQLLGCFTCATWNVCQSYYGGSDTFVFHMDQGYWKNIRQAEKIDIINSVMNFMSASVKGPVRPYIWTVT
eukprot:UN22632